MKPPASLRLRLLSGTLVWLLLSLALTGWGLRTLFRDHISQQLEEQLRVQLDHLSGALDWADGRLQVAHTSTDGRFEEPLSGLYWQIQTATAPATALAHSRSLWDEALALPPLPGPYPAQGYRRLQLQDAQGHALLAVARTLQLPDDGAPPLRLVVAGDEALLTEPLQRFTHQLLITLGLLAVSLALAAALQLQLLLRPLRPLRQGLAALRGGQAQQLKGQYPQELQPLVAELNHVLQENAAMVQRARTQAGNLAHALHTPLTILANAAAQHSGPLPTLVHEQVALAQRQVDWHLAHARAAAVHASGLATPVLEPIEALLRTMARLHSHIDFALAEGLPERARDWRFRGEGQDLYELLGNLLDNAGKWARRQVQIDVQIDVQPTGAQLHFTIDDDGPGIAPAQRQHMFARGVQLDEERPGSGLGLDIVRNLVQAYGGSIEVQDAPLGGARLVLVLPAA
ncbi:sensor histidine kinase [Acidovorax sp. HDW3]|uniref:sensor histidine kinase n=1 Tax=Acidovorax sp. HDW3 TaxID=2714923 RepID=UPI00140A39BE|nr:sensor histidine kinase [Acidovorax sp. HDW3]QIL45354.1 sensor histidine kinase [Acidovorax sp. HDW3]